jgi:uncharacterized protein
MFYVNPTDSKKSREIHNRKTLKKRMGLKDSERNVENEKSVFQMAFQETIVEQTNKDIEILYNEIEETGQNLYEESTIGNLLKYKNSVKKFLQTASKTMFRVVILRGRKVDLKIIRTIDEKLKFITDNFIELQNDKMQLLSEIDEIKGLVINIIY